VAVITNGSGVTVSAYVLDPSSVEPAELGAAADADARKWIRDGEGGSVEGGQPLQPSGTISGAISVRYHVTLAGRALDGELIRAARQDGFVVLVFVDAPQGGLDGSNPQWGPIRAAVLRVFAR
jgi:hypothetical protein